MENMDKKKMDIYLEQELEKIINDANVLIDYFWTEMKENSQGENFGFLGLRLRKRKSGISIEWYNAAYTKHTKQQLKLHIKKGKKDSYNLDTIKKHKQRRDYEIKLIDEIEPKLALIRGRAKALSRISLAVKRYKKHLK